MFKQGFKKTNIHSLEFLNLIQINNKDNQNKIKTLQFLSTSDLNEILETHIDNLSKIESHEEFFIITNNLEKQLYLKVIVDFYMTSAVAYFPKDVNVDFTKLVSESGYIHSFGNLIHRSDINKALPAEVSVSLDYALELSRKENKKCLIVPYCHEDFSSRDRTKSMFLSDGLDDVKLHITKTYIGQKRIHEFLEEYEENRSNDCCISPSNYKNSSSLFASRFPDHDMSTTWIVSDFDIDYPKLISSDKKNIFIYRQILKNENIFHLYEENKPAWASHTTIPHSLAGAMINIVRRWLPEDNSIICDPFSGSGTIYLESQKFVGLRCHSSDLSVINDFVLQDNIRFFQMGLQPLIELRDSLIEYSKISPVSFSPKKRKSAKSKGEKFLEVLKIVELWTEESNGDFLNLSQIDVEKGFNRLGNEFDLRILLYCALRASVRGRVDIERDTSSWPDVLKKEIEVLCNQMNNHIEEIETIGKSLQRDSSTIGRGSYSDHIMPPTPQGSSNDLFSLKEFSTADVKDLAVGVFDAIICDPPYGFNTDEDRVGIVEFSDLLVRKLVESLKPTGGQIVMALPRISYSGREIPYSLRSDRIGRAIIDYCMLTNRRCWKPAQVFPCPITDSLNPPYYWKSEKALLRKILHFWIYPQI